MPVTITPEPPTPAPEQPAPRTSARGQPTGLTHQPGPRPTGMQRAVNGLRIALPLVRKVLPLLEGQVFTTLSNLLAPQPAPPPADLSPLEGSLADLKSRHMELFNRLGEQSAALKRLTERLDQVQAAADRNALEQKELRDGLRTVGRKANLIAMLALCLLALSLGANLFLFLHFQRFPR
jgi:hypothetical protein